LLELESKCFCYNYVCRNGQARHLASGSMDKTVRIWDTVLGQTLRILSSHTEAVSALRWGGTGLIYSGSRDKTIKVWRSVDVSYMMEHWNLLSYGATSAVEF